MLVFTYSVDYYSVYVLKVSYDLRFKRGIVSSTLLSLITTILVLDGEKYQLS